MQVTLIGNRISAAGSKLLWAHVELRWSLNPVPGILLRRNFGHRDSDTCRGEGHVKTKEDLSNMSGWLPQKEVMKRLCVTSSKWRC